MTNTKDLAVAFGHNGAYLVQREEGILQPYYITMRGITLPLTPTRHNDAQRAARALAKKDNVLGIEGELGKKTRNWTPTHLVNQTPHDFRALEMNPRAVIEDGDKLHYLDPRDPLLPLMVIEPEHMLEVARWHWMSLGYHVAPCDRWTFASLRNRAKVDIWLMAPREMGNGSWRAELCVGYRYRGRDGSAIGMVPFWTPERGAQIVWFESPEHRWLDGEEFRGHVNALFAHTSREEKAA